MPRDRRIQQLLWAYFLLLLFEGALRKWVVPELSNPLLLVRDPICVWAILAGWRHLFAGSIRLWILSLWLIGALAIVAAVFIGHGDIPTAVFGARILLLHFPLIFLFGAVFSQKDLWKFALVTLGLAIPMTFLIIAQYSLPPDHIVNIAPGGEGTAGFSGALGKMRPPGTFSFISGLASFYGLACAFFVGWLACGPRPIPRWIWVSAACLLFALPLSISRTLAFYDILVVLSATAASLLAGRAIRSIAAGAVIITIMLAILSRFELFQDAQIVFLTRWENAQVSESPEGGFTGILASRIGGSMMDGLEMLGNVDFFGKGIGLGTNVGAMRAVGQKGFIVAEGAWPAMVGELGPLLGLGLILWRIALSLWLILSAVSQALLKNPLPMILGGLAVQGVLIGQTSQPTALGFLVVSAGLMLASSKRWIPLESDWEWQDDEFASTGPVFPTPSSAAPEPIKP